MNNNRLFFIMLIVLLGFMSWQAWQQDYNQPKPAVSNQTATSTTYEQSDLPAASVTGENDKSVPLATSLENVSAKDINAALENTAPVQNNSKKIRIKTDLLDLEIDTRGGTVTKADLNNYPITAGTKTPTIGLLSDDPSHFYIAQSGMVGTEGNAAPTHNELYTSEKNSYQMEPTDKDLSVPLIWQDASGVQVEKTFHFTRASYLIKVSEKIINRGNTPWVGTSYRQFQRIAPPTPKGGMFASMSNPEAFSFVGSAWFSPENKFEKLKFNEDYLDEPLKREFAGGWIAMVQHYFFTAWIPNEKETMSYNTDTLDGVNGVKYIVRSVSGPIRIEAGAQATNESRLYLGPKLQKQLPKIAPGLNLVSDYGMVTALANPLFWLLDKLHSLVKNWGIAIILLTLLVKLAFFKLSEAQYRSGAKMRKLQPRLQALKERYGDDRQKYSQAMLELQQKEKINPLGGCLPMLIQFPVFIALYWVLLESVEIRHAPFMGWIKNLTAPDPYFILPLLNIGIMWLTQKLTPMVGMDPIQQKMFKFMPLVFGVMFAFFPAGLVLYWVVNGGLGLIQQQIITKRIEAGDKKEATT